MLYGHPSTLYVYDSSNAHGPAMRMPSTRGVHQGCVLGAMFFAIVASRVYKQMAAIARTNPLSAVILTMVTSSDPCVSRGY
jgi:hypothetical protein